MKKSFIITVDTEPDGQWDLHAKPTTQNTQFIPRFQELCSEYGYKPVYLTDYVMLNDGSFVDRIGEWSVKNECEIGMHLHAWDTPPFVELDKSVNGRPFLIEYEQEIMEEKIYTITKKLRSIFHGSIISHRAGRWALDDKYIELLSKYEYKVDCSVTPHIDWSKTKGNQIDSKGSDYKNACEKAYYINENVLEVPVTIRKMNRLEALSISTNNYRQMIRSIIGKNLFWFRPALFSYDQMEKLYNHTKEDDYIEMMIHSSELMPGGSPYFKDGNDIEELYKNLKRLFKLIAHTHEGKTLKEYYYSLSSK